MGPHRAVRLVEASQAFTAADMATASAQGFRDGVASVAASAGSEPVALPSGWVPLTITHEGQYPEEVAYGPQIMMDRLGKWLGKYFAQIAAPTPTQGLQRLHDLLYTAQRTVGEEQRIAITAARVELSSLRSAGVPTGYWDGQAAAQAAVAAGWMPIDTAPKDGSAVLVYPPIWVQRTCSVATYKSDRYAKKPRPYWKRDDAMGKVGYSRDKPPTHWRPLPPAPSTEGESNE